MKQIVQNLKNGETLLEEVPVPEVKTGHLLIQTSKSLVSLGTEKMLVEFGKSNLIAKAKQQPEKVKQVLDKIKTEGLMPTLDAVFRKLEEPLPLGYCNVGIVLETGEGVDDFKPGDRVVSNGAHAQVVCVPKNLCAKVPDSVSDEEAVFTVIASIGLQGIRLANPTIGETVVVSGLGLIGLLTSQLLLANGCRVIGYDFDSQKVALAQSFGVLAFNLNEGVDPVKNALFLTQQIGVDAVLITASAPGNALVSQAAQMSRKRGRIILVGVTGLELNRSEFYEKELLFQVSCSYGPGRYDENYEKRGIDYPMPFVRWTEKRNFETILQLLQHKKINVVPLITEQVNLQDYLSIYGEMGKKGSIASLLTYPEKVEIVKSVTISNSFFSPNKKGLAIIGAGNFTKMTLMPILKSIGLSPEAIVSDSGVSGTFLAKKYGIAQSSTSFDEILSKSEIGSVIITTRHNLHAPMVLKSLKAQKHVFVEKPLALTETALNEIESSLKENPNLSVVVGFNRRFSPYVLKAKSLIGNSENPLSMNMTFNAGFIPENSWVHHPEIGGGRILGEACHYVDLFVFMTNSQVVSISAQAMGNLVKAGSDSASIILKAANGSIATINYFSNGNKSYPKERIEVYSQGKTLVIDNFRKLETYGFKAFSSMKGKLDKGHANQFKAYKAFLENGGPPPTSWNEVHNVSLSSLKMVEAMLSGETIKL
ncbi:MAG: bi-domain-containing oxidoreductase [Cytophagales bacterium]